MKVVAAMAETDGEKMELGAVDVRKNESDGGFLGLFGILKMRINFVH